MGRTWLVTGASGFLGRRVVDALAPRSDRGDRVLASGRRDGFVPLDLADETALAEAMASMRPDVVIHAAGRTPPAPADELEEGNHGATRRLLNVLAAAGRPVRVVLVGSAAELGPVAEADLPVGEDYPCRPADPYGLSKWRATCAGLEARAPLEVMIARVFNPVGPGMPASQALGRFAALLAEPGPDPVRLAAGDLDTRRDFIDVRDVADALIALADRGRPGLVYNVGSGGSRRVREGLDRLIALSGRRVVVDVDPALASRPGPRDSRASIGRIIGHTGWRPTRTLEQSLADHWADLIARPRRQASPKVRENPEATP